MWNNGDVNVVGMCCVSVVIVLSAVMNVGVALNVDGTPNVVLNVVNVALCLIER